MKKRNLFIAGLSLAASLFMMAGCENPAGGSSSSSSGGTYVQPSSWSDGTAATAGWVMSYFGTNGSSSPFNVAEDSLHLAFSTDGVTWSARNFN